MFWMKAWTFTRSAPIRVRSPLVAARANASRASDSRSTATSGPLPDRNAACVWTSFAAWRVATLSPTSVFPAPGTPVTNTIAFRLRSRASATMASTRPAVSARFLAPASLRVISWTVWLPYRARAASRMVGVGL